jgi:hypothetical protein
MTRDPRTDPAPGDVLGKGLRQRRVVVLAHGFVAVHMPGRVLRYMTTQQWRKWARDAEVLALA